MRKIWIGVERNHTVLLLYVYVFILSISVYIIPTDYLKLWPFASIMHRKSVFAQLIHCLIKVILRPE